MNKTCTELRLSKSPGVDYNNGMNSAVSSYISIFGILRNGRGMREVNMVFKYIQRQVKPTAVKYAIQLVLIDEAESRLCVSALLSRIPRVTLLSVFSIETRQRAAFCGELCHNYTIFSWPVTHCAAVWQSESRPGAVPMRFQTWLGVTRPFRALHPRGRRWSLWIATARCAEHGPGRSRERAPPAHAPSAPP